ncbi:hypothetical protein [Mycolicibacterium smegmatis]|uniref:hypothetical protein n=1 Tax=Mycolicibacterium smegmatis TaxID=1772 RepID=UPI0005D94E66|nr:hypothetical protein [Mycolicibacterium smegmatis]UAK53480.1 hypothetical protein K8P01_23135 [Mycolicibacterium smegmatis]CKH17171.1 transposase [Mycolicibacterium smegmatis]
MDAYNDLRDIQIPTRKAAEVTGMHRSTATRRAKPAPAPADRAPRPVPVNKLTESECTRVVEVLNSARFVDAAPMQVWATLLDEGSYLCSVSTMYRVLNANKLVKERRRLARHRKAVCPELVATAPRQVYSWDITKLAGPVKGVWRVPDTESTRFWSRVGVIQFQLMLQATGVWVQLQTAAYSAGVR